jgi:predicted amidohydrolase YtcJ
MCPRAAADLVVRHARVSTGNPANPTAEAVAAGCTSGGAFAEFQEAAEGTISPGRQADWALLSSNPFDVSPEAIGGISVDLAVVGGAVVFERP